MGHATHASMHASAHIMLAAPCGLAAILLIQDWILGDHWKLELSAPRKNNLCIIALHSASMQSL